jgi:hypothetical protein
MTAQPTPPKLCACRLAPVATKEEHAAAHAAGKCVPCYKIYEDMKLYLSMTAKAAK